MIHLLPTRTRHLMVMDSPNTMIGGHVQFLHPPTEFKCGCLIPLSSLSLQVWIDNRVQWSRVRARFAIHFSVVRTNPHLGKVHDFVIYNRELWKDLLVPRKSSLLWWTIFGGISLPPPCNNKAISNPYVIFPMIDRCLEMMRNEIFVLDLNIAKTLQQCRTCGKWHGFEEAKGFLGPTKGVGLVNFPLRVLMMKGFNN